MTKQSEILRLISREEIESLISYAKIGNDRARGPEGLVAVGEGKVGALDWYGADGHLGAYCNGDVEGYVLDVVYVCRAGSGERVRAADEADLIYCARAMQGGLVDMETGVYDDADGAPVFIGGYADFYSEIFYA